MMNFNKFATALVIAAVVAAPAGGAFAASTMAAPSNTMAAPAKPMMATPEKPMMTKAAPIMDPSGLVGRWSLADISALDGAKIKIVDLNKVYAKDRHHLAAAAKADKDSIAKLHTALNSDAKFKAWAKKNHINPERVVGVSNGEIAVL